MEAPICLGIRGESLPRDIYLTCVFKVGLQTLGVVVWVNEVLACVIRRVDINHLNFSKISLLHQLQRFEAVALYDHVFCCIEVETFLAARSESAEAGALNGFEAVGFPRPVHAVAFLAGINSFPQRTLQTVKINFAALSANFWKKTDNLRLLVASDVMRPQIQTFRLFGRRGLGDSGLSVRIGHRYSPSSNA